jgi:anthranilate phosphoribosyltransferase
MLNPLRATASLQSIFHPAYARLHQEADVLLDQPRALVFKGESGEVEVKPHADTRLSLLQDRQLREMAFPRCLIQRIESVDSPSVEPVRSMWRGGTSNHYGLSATLATTAAALLVLVPELSLEDAQQQASQLWTNRNLARLN